jgi:hypothetical protein
MTILTDWDLPLTADDVLRGQGADPAVLRARRPLIASAAEEALQRGRPKIRPAVVIEQPRVKELRHTRLLLDGGALSGPLVARHLGKAERLAVVVCTVGPELEEEASRLLLEDPALSLGLDGLANAAVDLLAVQVCARLGEQAAEQGLQASTPISPGADEWPVGVGQPELFDLLDASQIGVRLTESCLMLPRKSVSFVVGFGQDVGQGLPCELCSLKDTCRYRSKAAEV